MTPPMWPKKRAKVKAISALLGRVDGARCLSLGTSDRRVCDALRACGGRWVHVAPDGSAPRLACHEGAFDVVVVADVLEHVVGDRLLASEALRCLRPGGRLILTAPVPPSGPVARLRHTLGLTDADFGHRRPGCSATDLREVLEAHGAVVQALRTLGGGVNEILELTANGLLGCLRRRAGHRAPALPIPDDWRGRRGAAARVVGRVVAALSLLDHLPGMGVAATTVVLAYRGTAA